MRLFCTRAGGLVELPAQPEYDVYVCGVTPYDSTHLGHVAVFALYDVLARRLEELGASVRLVRNITDVDDPILPRVQSLGVRYADLVEDEVAQFARDMKALGFRPAYREPRASESVGDMVATIEEMLAGGHAYALGDTVYFDVSTCPRWGEVSGLDEATMVALAAERGGDPERPGKRNPLDFVLWQPSREGEPAFEAPFGTGRPGWHIGCTAMGRRWLGATIDVHGGGEDLKFPHHEAENAQNVSVAEPSEVGIWSHGAFVSYQGEKMSKSRGNIVLARDLLGAGVDGRVIRYAVLRMYDHRAGAEWFDPLLDDAGERFARLLEAARRPAGPDPRPYARRARAALDEGLDVRAAVRELEALGDATLEGNGDDPAAIGELHALARVLGTPLDEAAPA